MTDLLAHRNYLAHEVDRAEARLDDAQEAVYRAQRLVEAQSEYHDSLLVALRRAEKELAATTKIVPSTPSAAPATTPACNPHLTTVLHFEYRPRQGPSKGEPK